MKPSFRKLLDTHRRLNELSLLHQEALISLDLAAANALLKDFEGELLDHMHAEEDLLFPVYGRIEPCRGGGVDLFAAEHAKMRTLLAAAGEALARIGARSDRTKREVIRLMDREAQFKAVMSHHDLREDNILYPALDTVTSEDERRELIARTLDYHSKGVAAGQSGGE